MHTLYIWVSGSVLIPAYINASEKKNIDSYDPPFSDHFRNQCWRFAKEKRKYAKYGDFNGKPMWSIIGIFQY